MISFLENRKQFESIGNTYSDICQIQCGVPQGSVLKGLCYSCFTPMTSTTVPDYLISTLL